VGCFLGLSFRFVARLASGLSVVLFACAQRSSAAPRAPDFPQAVSIYSATEQSTGGDTVELVTYRDDKTRQHRVEVHFTSYPIVVTSVRVDDRDVPPGESWGRLGRALLGAGLDNNATLLLRCFGGDPAARC
jgi:hypothetical protein